MTRSLPRLAALLGAAVLVFLLTACGDVTPDEAKAYIQGDLDACYLGQYNEEYLEITGMTADEAEEQCYLWNTSAEADILMNYFELYPTDATTRLAVELIQDIYAGSKYQVGSASKLEDGSYAVTVTVQPIDIIYRYTSQNDPALVWAEALDRHGIYTQEALDAMSDEAYLALEDDYAAAVLGGIRDLLPRMGYGPQQSVVLQLQLKDNSYTLVETDWQHFDGMVIDYTGQYCGLSASSTAVA